MKNRSINFLGWLGVVMIIGTYFFVTFDLLDSQSTLYLILNLVGSISIAIETFYKRDLQPGVLNSIWALIALAGLIRIILR